jgi:uncharacterized protein (TIGR02391 family)
MTMTWGMPIDPDKAVAWPVEKVALTLLADFSARGRKPHRHNFLNSARQAYQHNDVKNIDETVQALAEAFDWLIHQGLLARNPSDDWCFVTRRGRTVLAAADGYALVRAQARLDVDLHPRIAAKVRAQFHLGEYELAAFAAQREVEIRVRELADMSDSDIGVNLMTKAFKEGGPLRNKALDPGEQEATMALFRGAIGVFKNPSSHRQVDYADPTMASEIVLLADLLLRLLDANANAND